MSGLGRGIGGLIWRMGVLCVLCSLLVGLGIGLAAIFPQAVPSWLMAEISGILNPYSQFEPDEYVFDFSLSADVPRVYYLSIPRLGLNAPVVAVEATTGAIDGQRVSQLHVPNAFAVGWSKQSAPVGQRGNTVFVGHNNEYGEVFKGLWDLQPGDEIIVHTASGDRRYYVSQTVMLQEMGRSLEDRSSNGRWLAPTGEERLTLITCWPYISNTHRTVVVAYPG